MDIFGLQPGERVLQFASLSFDASLWEIILALYAGATLCLASKETLLPGAALVRLLQEQAITTVTLPPSALSVLPVMAFPALQVILTTGEACSAELVEDWVPAIASSMAMDQPKPRSVLQPLNAMPTTESLPSAIPSPIRRSTCLMPICNWYPLVYPESSILEARRSREAITTDLS